MIGARRSRVAGLSAALAAAAALQAPAGDPGGATRAARAEERIASFVLRRAALDNVRELVALGPRMGGTRSGAEAALLVSRRLRELGLETETVVDPEVPAHEESSWTVALAGRALASAWPYGFSPPLSRVTAPLVADSVSGPEGEAPQRAGAWDGAVVLTGGTVRDLYHRAVEAGAIALLTDAPGDPARYVAWAPIGDLDHEGGPPPLPAFGLSYQDGRLLRDALAAGSRGAPPPRVTLALASRRFTGRPLTVEATMAGTGSRAREGLLVCAHGDSDAGGPGADDNASGVAALIEVARALTSAASHGLLPPARPAVTFVVWGAEIHSTRAWFRRRAAAGRPLAVLNFDQCGTGAERDAIYYEGNDVPGNGPLLRILEAVAQDHAGKEGFWTDHTSTPLLGGTDTDVFLPAAGEGGGGDARIAATTIFTAAWDRPRRLRQTPGWRSKGWPEGDQLFVDYSDYYHSSGDLPEATTETEPHNIERCARLAALGLYRLMRVAPVTAPPEGPPVPGTRDPRRTPRR